MRKLDDRMRTKLEIEVKNMVEQYGMRNVRAALKRMDEVCPECGGQLEWLDSDRVTCLACNQLFVPEGGLPF